MQASGLFENCIQIAGVVDAAEAALLRAAGVRLLGFPLRLPVHREDLGEAEAARLIRTLPSDVHAILITYMDEAREIARFADVLGVAAVQLHGEIDPGELERLRGLRPGLATIKSLVVGRYSEADLGAQVLRMSPYVDAFITDTFDPATGASGATGKTHDWAVSRALVERSPRPVILAGGLTPANVRSAIRAVRPAGVDAHTGVEGPDGRKDPTLVRRFVAGARAGFADLAAPGARSES